MVDNSEVISRLVR